jgi:hypothetical protein
MLREQLLYSSTSRAGLKTLRQAPLPRSEGFRKGERGVWATDNLILSRAFGIDRKEFGTFYLDPAKLSIALVDWKFEQIPKDFIAYTYSVESNGFDRVKIRDWKFVSHTGAKVVKAEPYLLRPFLLKHYEISELTTRKVTAKVN